jgi:hypothetical protein
MTLKPASTTPAPRMAPEFLGLRPDQTQIPGNVVLSKMEETRSRIFHVTFAIDFFIPIPQKQLTLVVKVSEGASVPKS